MSRPRPALALAAALAALAACPSEERAAAPAPTPAPAPAPRPRVMRCAEGAPACPPGWACAPDGTCGRGDEVLVPAGPFTRGCSLAASPGAAPLEASPGASPLAASPGAAPPAAAPAPAVDPLCLPDEQPPRLLSLPAFALDRTEVTVDAWAACVAAGACTPPACAHQPLHPRFHRCTWGREGAGSHPVNGVTWDQARAYCAWRGRRLPTEDEWEKAARGPDARRYAWGDEPLAWDGPVRANLADVTAAQAYGWPTVAPGYDDGFAGTAPVGRYPAGASPYGALDLTGNVWEWTASTYQPPGGLPPGVGGSRVIRGGGYANHARYVRAAFRHTAAPDAASPDLGFRCARDLDGGAPPGPDATTPAPDEPGRAP